jgi:hypothetical protein
MKPAIAEKDGCDSISVRTLEADLTSRQDKAD